MKECHRCGSTRHLGDACPKKSSTCFKCKTVGHLSHKCRKVMNGNQDRTQKQGKIYYEGADEYHQDTREEIDLVEEGLNFVSLYRLDAVEAEDNNKEQNNDSEESIKKETEEQIEEELNQYKKWVENALEKYWEMKEPDTETEDDYYELDEIEESEEELSTYEDDNIELVELEEEFELEGCIGEDKFEGNDEHQEVEKEERRIETN